MFHSRLISLSNKSFQDEVASSDPEGRECPASHRSSLLDGSLPAGLGRESHPVVFSQKLATEAQSQGLDEMYRKGVSSGISRTPTGL